ncbi:MAG TPA: hypothetical protein VGC13_09535 [Longimicrobium sp.]|uniref:hypothetical protein n=1 Tax=Longimicrobium sp. TaxID=2029185 RepID=UPI002EDA528E
MPASAPASAPAAVAADPCASLRLDLVRGTLNGVAPTATMDEVKRRLPCATGESEETSEMNFGGGVFFLNHDFFFYTGRNYIEVRRRFRGTVTPDVLGRPIGDAQRVLGPHARTLERRGSMLFRAHFGCVEARLSRDGTRTVEQVAAYAMLCELVPDDA